MSSAAPQSSLAAASGEILSGWRIVFGARGGASDASIAIDDTSTTFAFCEPTDAEKLLAGACAPCDLALMAAPLTAGLDIQGGAEAWARAEGPAIEARLKTSRVVVARRRALVLAPADQRAATMNAVVRYGAICAGVEALEGQVARALRDLEVKSPALPAMSPADAAAAKLSLLRWQRAIEQFQPGLSPHSQRLFSELDEAGRLEERIEMLEDPVQTLYDFAALTSERKHYSVGIVIEVAILLVLLCELAMMIVQVTR